MIALAVSLALQSLPAGWAVSGNADDATDATCVVAIGLAKDTARGRSSGDNLAMLGAFYVGRISARASARDWRAIISREAAMHIKASEVNGIVLRCVRRMDAIAGLHPIEPVEK